MFAASILVVIVAIGMPLMVGACARGRIGINPIAGIRIRSVMSSDGAWRAGHKASLPAVWVGAAVAAALGLFSLPSRLSDDDRAIIIIAAAIALVVSLLIGSFFANRAALDHLAREHAEEEHESEPS